MSAAAALTIAQPKPPTRSRRKPARRAAPKPKPQPRTLSPMAWALCAGLPFTSFGLVWLVGECFLSGVDWLGWCASALVAFILVVSAPHCAAAVASHWRTGARDGWCVAVALEGAIVVLDLTHLCGPETLRTAALVALALPIAAVALLNAAAVRMH